MRSLTRCALLLFSVLLLGNNQGCDSFGSRGNNDQSLLLAGGVDVR